MNTLKPVIIGKNSVEEVKTIFDKIISYTGYDLELCNKLDEKFFTDPASHCYHNSVENGLFFHSINVAAFAYKFINVIYSSGKCSDCITEQYMKDTVFAALFHDVDKIGHYLDEDDLTDAQKYRINKDCINNNLSPDFYIANLGKESGSTFIDALAKGDVESAKLIRRKYKYVNTFDTGHGEGSVIRLLSMGFKLTEHQILSIRYHQGSYDVEWNLPYRHRVIEDYMNKIPMLRAITLADQMTSFLYE